MPVAKTESRRLYRSETDRVLGGVAAGLAEFFEIDPIIIRIIFILLFLQGAGILLYLLLWIVIPTESKAKMTTREAIHENAEEIKAKAKAFAEDMRHDSHWEDSRLWFGIAIVILGIYFLLENLGLLGYWHLGRLWPLLLIFLGLAILGKKKNE